MKLLDVNLGSGGGGSVGAALLRNNMDVKCLRPWEGKDGRSYISRNTGRMVKNSAGKQVPELQSVPVQNVSGFLRKDDWATLDTAIVKVSKSRLKIVADLRAMGLQFTIPNGLGKMALDTERQSDINEATVSMSPTQQSFNDRPLFDLQQMPLPCIHKDFSYDVRQLMASRNGGSPLDTATAELAARRVAEQVENLTLGTSSFSAINGNVQGLTNFTDRLTKVMTNPTHSGWTGSTTVTEVLAMRLQSTQAAHYGPWMLYTSLDWDQYLDADYKTTYNATTLRQRLQMIKGIIDVRTLDYLPNKTMVLVQMTPDVIRMIVGMEITTVQWESKGGMEVNFKVICIINPQLRSDFNKNTGIVHGTYT